MNQWIVESIVGSFILNDKLLDQWIHRLKASLDNGFINISVDQWVLGRLHSAALILIDHWINGSVNQWINGTVDRLLDC